MSDPQLRELIAEAKEDEVGLWLVIAKVRGELGLTDPPAVRGATLTAIRQLLGSGEVQAGDYQSDRSGIETWQIEPEEAVSRIVSAWDALGREPDIGEVVVFVGSRRSSACAPSGMPA